jgi:hypothetical protein
VALDVNGLDVSGLDANGLDANGLDVLGPTECLDLLATRSLGRIGVTIDGLPAVLPVNYVLDGDEVVIRTSRGTKLSEVTRHDIVAFEVDDVDPESGVGWSVLVRGLARERFDPPAPVTSEESPLAAWLDPARSRYIAISADLVSGRRHDPGRRVGAVAGRDGGHRRRTAGDDEAPRGAGAWTRRTTDGNDG